MYFGHAPKHMIRLSVEYRQDSKIPIRLWISLVEDTPTSEWGADWMKSDLVVAVL